ncbi:response regulator [Thalassotalea euphylliae]|uniref:response regulator n=1 Tax=Thalassotalea euphylliae TaxID=1655234 RepID=UPI00363F5A57
MFNTQSLITQFSKRYRFALVLVALVVTASFFTLDLQYRHQRDDAEIINTAGQQRMLSQKIALMSWQYINPVTDPTQRSYISSEIINAAEKMRDNQYRLSTLLNDPLPDNVDNLYFGDVNLNERVATFVDHAKSLTKQADVYSIEQSDFMMFDRLNVEALLVDLDNAVKAFQQNTEDRLSFIETVGMVIWVMSLLALILVGRYIFKPLKQVLKDTYDALLREKNKVSEFQTAINKHSVVVQLDKDGNIKFYNRKFCQQFGYTSEELVGQSYQVLQSQVQADTFLDNMLEELKAGHVWRGETCNLSKNHRRYWFSTTAVPMSSNGFDIDNFILIQNDVTEQKRTEIALKRLHDISADPKHGLDVKINAILGLGKELFQLPFGIVSEIHDDEYKVLYVDTPEGEIEVGATFSFEGTYCFHTFNANGPLSFHHAGQSEISGHPCYTDFGLETYIGTPIMVNGEKFGTLNFSSPDVYPHPFTDADLELIQLFGQWIGFELMRKAQRQELESHQQLMSQMSLLARIGAWEVDLVTNTIYWSDMTKLIHEVPLNYEPDLETAINFYKEGYSRDLINTLVQESIESGKSYHVELQLVTAKGNDIWVAAKGESEFVDGKCVRLFGSFQDINERKLTESALQDKNERMELAADSAGFGVWDYNILTEEMEWDDWMYRLFGVSELSERSAAEVWDNGLHPEDKQVSEDHLSRALGGDEKFTNQFRIVWPNGEVRHLKASAITKKNEHGEVTNMVGVNYDVTEQVHNELALTKAKVEAEAAAKAKSEFLASMSHEIRTPMNGVLGMLELLKDEELSPDQSHKVKIATSSANSLLSLINDILDFSKIDADKLDIESIPFDLNQMLSELVEALATQAESKQLELILDTVSIAESHVIGDPSRIRQILTNLISNAIKFTHEGEVVVSASMAEDGVDNWRLILSVKDTGIGISDDKKHLLFESFRQLDASTTRNYGGTGLGLAIVKKLCLLMDGDIRVDSNNTGSEFICDIRVGKSEQVTTEMPSVDMSALHILVVDDNTTNREVIAKQLMKWGIKVTLAESAQQAIEQCHYQLAQNNPMFDIAILDMQMPNMDGEALAVGLKANPEFSGMKLVMMTSMQSRGDGKHFANLGFSGYFPKPVVRADLFAALHIIADGGSALERAKPLVTQHYIKEIHDPNALQTDSADTSIALDALNILLVEDNRVNQMVAKGVLNKMGLDCDIAINGVDALNKMREKHYQLALMDIQMPEMDGYEATQRIRQGEAGDNHRDIKIIAMTANAMSGDREKCIAAGMDEYLAKPINKEALHDRLAMFFM